MTESLACLYRSKTFKILINFAHDVQNFVR